MYCKKCGRQLNYNQKTCPNCGTAITPKINNIFTALVSEKTLGSNLEFGIWIVVCLMGIVLFLNAFLVSGADFYTVSSRFRMLWLFLFVFAAGYAVIIAFRLKALAIYYSVISFFFVMFISWFMCKKRIFSAFYEMVDKETSPLIWLLFVFALLVAVGLISCLSVHFFSRYDLGKVCTILTSVMMGLLLLLCIATVAMPRYTYKSERESRYRKDYNYTSTKAEEEAQEDLEGVLENYSFTHSGLGTAAYMGMCFVTGIYLILFFTGVIDNEKQKLLPNHSDRNQYVGNRGYIGNYGNVPPRPYDSAPSNMANMPHQNRQTVNRGVYVLSGSQAGQIYSARGDMVLGSQVGQANIVLQERYVSHQHCIIRFNDYSGKYEVKDISTNGVRLTNGVQFQKGIFMACEPGTELCLGSMEVRIRLL